MNNQRISIIAFIILALIQLAIPSWMIMHREGIKGYGRKYLFKCRPVDPNDPFRGKYITLRFDASDVRSRSDYEWESNETAYAVLDTDAQGFAIIKDLIKTIPIGEDYIQVQISYSDPDGVTHIQLPFDRYYMEESKAKKAEELYGSMVRYADVVAEVSVHDGQAVLNAVLIDGVPIENYIK